MRNLDAVRASIVTITYNEKEVIGPFLLTVEKILEENGYDGEIIVVDDNSPDGTAEVVQKYASKYKNIRLISRPGKMGIGSAFLAGISASKGDIVVTMDADLSHPPTSLEPMIQKAMEGFVVYGSRFLERKSFNTDFYRKLGTIVLNKWMKLFFRTDLRDFTDGYMAILRAHLDRITSLAETLKLPPFDKVLYGIPIYVLASHLGLKTTEVSAPYEFRKAGETKIKFFNGMKILLEDMLYIALLPNRLKCCRRVNCHENSTC